VGKASTRTKTARGFGAHWDLILSNLGATQAEQAQWIGTTQSVVSRKRSGQPAPAVTEQAAVVIAIEALGELSPAKRRAVLRRARAHLLAQKSPQGVEGVVGSLLEGV